MAAGNDNSRCLLLPITLAGFSIAELRSRIYAVVDVTSDIPSRVRQRIDFGFDVRKIYNESHINLTNYI